MSEKSDWVRIDDYAAFITDWRRVSESSPYSTYTGPWKKQGEERYCEHRFTSTGVPEMKPLGKKTVGTPLYV